MFLVFPYNNLKKNCCCHKRILSYVCSCDFLLRDYLVINMKTYMFKINAPKYYLTKNALVFISKSSRLCVIKQRS